MEPPKKVTEQILSAVYKVSERPKKKPKTPASVSREQISVNKGHSASQLIEDSVSMHHPEGRNNNDVEELTMEKFKVAIGSDDTSGTTSTTNKVKSVEVTKSAFTLGTYSCATRQDVHGKFVEVTSDEE
ncbi:MAG: hypothetical protein MMC23_005281 [Stictis urceolatum]|nr:hypothetical protein [Stictis urceolata]